MRSQSSLNRAVNDIKYNCPRAKLPGKLHIWENKRQNKRQMPQVCHRRKQRRYCESLRFVSYRLVKIKTKQRPKHTFCKKQSSQTPCLRAFHLCGKRDLNDGRYLHRSLPFSVDLRCCADSGTANSRSFK